MSLVGGEEFGGWRKRTSRYVTILGKEFKTIVFLKNILYLVNVFEKVSYFSHLLLKNFRIPSQYNSPQYYALNLTGPSLQ